VCEREREREREREGERICVSVYVCGEGGLRNLARATSSTMGSVCECVCVRVCVCVIE